MKRYEFKIEIIDEKYVDTLIVALARQGFNVYLSIDTDAVCITIDDSMMVEVPE